MAHCGVASRRQCDLLIDRGEVSINGKTIRELGFQIDEERDRVYCHGKPVAMQAEKMIMLNKPSGYLVTASDPHGRRTVFDLLIGIRERFFSVGRLDHDTTGLLLLTTNGKLSHRLTHPKYHVRKTYHAVVQGVPTEDELEQLRTGIKLEDGITAPARARVIRKRRGTSWLEIKIFEGRKRQVRRMAEAIGHPVIDLKRTAIDWLTLGKLPVGKWRDLTSEEIKKLKNRVNYQEESS